MLPLSIDKNEGATRYMMAPKIYCLLHLFVPAPVPGTHQTADRSPLHGPLTLPRISPDCPHCVIPVPPGAVTGQKYHCACTFHRRAGSDPAFWNCTEIAHSLIVVILEKSSRVVPSAGLLARAGMYLMAVYSVVKDQNTNGRITA